MEKKFRGGEEKLGEERRDYRRRGEALLFLVLPLVAKDLETLH